MTSSTAPAAAARSPMTTTPARRWAPRMWVGMCLGTWLGLLVRNRFQVSPRYWHKAVLITVAAFFNSLWWIVEQLVFGIAVRRTKVDPRPLIILGHWRSGTTWLHELLGLDPQFTSPSTFQAMSPSHFLVTKWWATKVFFWLMPAKRPMDDMPMGWDRPQEDEFALCNLGERSPYLTVAFPNHGPVYEEYLTLDVPPADVARWKRTLYQFLQKVTFAERKRLIIKSPPHTARVRTLLEMFPEARFVYLVRDPYALFASTVHLWRRLYETHGMQVPNYEGIEEYVLRTFVRIRERFEQDRELIPPGRLYEVRYEDLVQDPLARLSEIYQRLELGDFAKVRAKVERFLAESADYKTNRYSLTEAQRKTVTERWAAAFESHGYERS
jgi:LPS sulfotransferase NodH